MRCGISFTTDEFGRDVWLLSQYRLFETREIVLSKEGLKELYAKIKEELECE